MRSNVHSCELKPDHCDEDEEVSQCSDDWDDPVEDEESCLNLRYEDQALVCVAVVKSAVLLMSGIVHVWNLDWR